MKEYTTGCVIEAPAEKVWAILADAGAYREWNPEIIAIDGRIAAGERITAHVRLGSGTVQKVRLEVTSLEAPRRMEWTGGLPLGLFRGVRVFTLAPDMNGTRFQLHLRMDGLLSPMILKSVGDRQPEVDRFSAALKARAEGTR